MKTDGVTERENIPGIYVYALPHYLRYPFDVGSGRTLLKVGRSERDPFAPIAGQTRITALAEYPVLLRVYQVEPGQSAEVERDFHAWLDDANYDRSRSLRGGTYWFLTSTKFLDGIARSRSTSDRGGRNRRGWVIERGWVRRRLPSRGVLSTSTVIVIHCSKPAAKMMFRIPIESTLRARRA